jgi:hypothetical protein
MEGRNAFILRLTPLGQDLTQEALEKDEIFVGWKEVKDLLKEDLSFDKFRERVKAAYNIENNRSAAAFARFLWEFLTGLTRPPPAPVTEGSNPGSAYLR